MGGIFGQPESELASRSGRLIRELEVKESGDVVRAGTLVDLAVLRVILDSTVKASLREYVSGYTVVELRNTVVAVLCDGVIEAGLGTVKSAAVVVKQQAAAGEQ